MFTYPNQEIHLTTQTTQIMHTAPARSRFASLVLALFTLLAIASPAPAQMDLFGGTAGPPGAGESPVEVSFLASTETARPGDQIVVAVIINHDTKWHTWPRAPFEGEADVLPEDIASFALRTEINPGQAPAGLLVGPTQWPETSLNPVPNVTAGGTIDVPSYAGRAIAYIPILVADDAAPGEFTLPIDVFFQACDDTTCLPPEDASFTLTVSVAADTAAATATGEDFAGFEASIFAEIAAGTATAQAAAEVPAATRSFLGVELPNLGGFAGVLLTALLAAIGGLVLNLTPCVLPVIPIKVMTISQHAGTPGKSLVLGLWMALGVIAFWVGIGLPVAFLTSVTDPSRVFGIWWVTLGIGLIIGVMGVGIMGLFVINLPQKVYMVNPKADSAWGSFVFGVMTAVLGLPCFGFVAGALLAGAATLPPAVILTIFFALGLGMASPYLVMSAKPSLVDKIPRTGPASELVKQVMGLLLMAAAAYFIGSGILALLKGGTDPLAWWSTIVHWWAVALFGVAAGGWLAWQTFTITKKLPRRAFFGIVGLIVAATPIAYAADITSKARENFWVPFSQDQLVASVDSGNVVVIDFTAEWCLNCKALKAAVLTREPVKSQLLGSGVVPMVADLTSTKAPGWDKLSDLGQAGIPLLVVYGPGLDRPWMSNAYTTEQVMDAIERARGTAASAAR